MSSEIDVLSLEWATKPNRDRIMATLVCNYLRLQGLKVEEGSVFDGFHALNRVKPKMFFIANSIGAWENQSLVRYAKSRGALVLTLISEGVFFGGPELHQEMIWGWNKDKVLQEDRQLQWSKRTRDITIADHPELADRIGISGGVGFDNYRIGKKRIDRANFLAKYGKPGFSKVIGIGCFDFASFDPGDPRFRLFSEVYSEAQIQRFRDDAAGFDRALTEVVNAFPDVLFLVKHHPGGYGGHRGAGTEGVANCPNVLVLTSEESIFDCIAVSDFWLVYESTTALEAWLLGKQTCLLNPSGRDFPRALIAEGSPDYVTSEQLLNAIRTFYESGELPGFGDRESSRRKVVEQTIGWDDGLNHVRAGNAILDLLEERASGDWQDETWPQRARRWVQHARWLIMPFIRPSESFRTSDGNRRNFDRDQLKDYTAIKRVEQLDFYRSRNLTLQQLRSIRSD